MSYFEDYKTENPVLQNQMFKETNSEIQEKMGLEGTLNKIRVAFGIVFVAALYGWGNASLQLMFIGALGGVALAYVTMSNKSWAPVTVPVFALFEGLFLGSFSATLDGIIPGIISQAIFVTILVLGAVLGSYHLGVIKAMPRLKKIAVFAVATILVIYILKWFGLPMVKNSSLLGTILSFFVLGVAALNLIIDFDLVEKAIEKGLPKHMEWYGAFAIMVTLVWLYVEVRRIILQLMAKNSSGGSSNKSDGSDSSASTNQESSHHNSLSDQDKK